MHIFYEIAYGANCLQHFTDTYVPFIYKFFLQGFGSSEHEGENL